MEYAGSIHVGSVAGAVNDDGFAEGDVAEVLLGCGAQAGVSRPPQDEGGDLQRRSNM